MRNTYFQSITYIYLSIIICRRPKNTLTLLFQYFQVDQQLHIYLCDENNNSIFNYVTSI